MANQPVWNPSDKDADVTLSSGNRTWMQNSGTVGSVRSTVALSSGKWRVQLLHITSAGSANRHGFATAAHSISVAPGEDTTSWAINGQGDSEYNGTTVSLGGNYGNGDVVNLYIDITAGKIWYGDSSGPFSGDPAAGTGAHHTFTGGTSIYLCDGMNGGGSNRGGTLRLLADYTGSPPTGFTDGWGGASSTVYDQSLSATLAATASIRKSVQKRLAASVTLTAAIRKTVTKTLAVAITLTAALARIAVFPVHLVASASLTASIRKEVQKRVSATLDSTASIRKTVAKRISATLDSAAFIAKAFPVRLVATLSSTASIRKTVSKGLAATVAITASMQRIKIAIVSLSATVSLTASITMIRLFYRTLTATITLTGSIRKTISKRLVATQSMIAKPVAWIAYLFSATRNDKPNWNQCPRCARRVRPNKLIQQMEYRGPRLVWTGLYVCHTCIDEPQPQGRWPRETGGDPKPVILARPRRD